MKMTRALEILGIRPSSSVDDVKNAYRLKAMETHPDRGGSDDAFNLVVEAYEHVCKFGTAPSGLFLGGVPLSDAAEGLKDFAASMARQRQTRRRKRYTPEEAQTMKERTFQQTVKKSLEAVGAQIYNIHGHAMQTRGIPDLYIAHPLWTGWLELKVGSRKSSPLQTTQMNILVLRAVPAFVLRLSSDAVGLTAEFDDTTGSTPLNSDTFPEETDKKVLGQWLLEFLNTSTKALAVFAARDIGMWSWQGTLRTTIHGTHMKVFGRDDLSDARI